MPASAGMTRMINRKKLLDKKLIEMAINELHTLRDFIRWGMSNSMLPIYIMDMARITLGMKRLI